MGRIAVSLTPLVAFALGACSGTTPGPMLSMAGTTSAVTQGAASRIFAPAGKSSALMYLASGSAVYVYEQAGINQSPIATLSATVLAAPSGMYVDDTGDLYVTNPYQRTIGVYHKGAPSPYKTLTGLVRNSTYRNDVTTDSSGTVYGVAQESKEVYVYANGSTTPTSILKTRGIASEVATDASGNLFVQLFNGGTEEFEVGSTIPKTLKAATGSPGGIAVDAKGNLILCDLGMQDGFGGSIYIYAPPYTAAPIAETSLFNGVYGCTVNRATGTVWAATSGNVSNAQRFDSQLRLTDTIAVLRGASGIAVDPVRP